MKDRFHNFRTGYGHLLQNHQETAQEEADL